MFEDQRRQFERDGYAVFERLLSLEFLGLLRDQCDAFVAREDARMEALGVHSLGITHRGKRYFANECQRVQPALRAFLFSETMAHVCRVLLGDTVYFFFDQFVVKCPEAGLPFSWHQDSGYMVGNGGPADHAPYLTCWISLDDATVQNGTVRVLPFSKMPQARDAILPHVRQPQTNDLIGWTGGETGDVLEVPAGSLVAFSSRLMPATGANLSDRPRRVYLAQYSAEAILNPGTRQLRRNAIPLVQNGLHVTTA